MLLKEKEGRKEGGGEEGGKERKEDEKEVLGPFGHVCAEYLLLGCVASHLGSPLL
jgi:hypothetical protein